MPQVTGPITTTGSADTFPTHDSQTGKGGLREVADTTARDAVPADRRRAGMLVYVAADDTYYSLNSDLTTWAPLTLEGGQGWSPLLALVSDSARRVYQIVDWVGGDGTKPSTSNLFLGASGIVSTAAAAVDVRGPQGVQGDQGIQGIQGVKGDQGIQGVKGDTGSAGTNGTNGTDGTNGVDAHPIYVSPAASPTSPVGKPNDTLYFEYN